ncbi:LptF/LptG family permease [Sulfurimonas sp.]|uniref:LptF/LptG family permease n=1 Tax=Sulfurimonas sp. TaxID=2022749 RepID=UPI0026168F31|nr:LptF/LptG family permease [Sulfurimonas sp.]
MDILRNYILRNFSSLFLSIFLPLFAIASVIFLIKLATYTAIIQLNIFEMTKLYLFVLPEILFYTLPVTFFIASTLSLARLSNDNEIVVIFSLGIKPAFIVKTFFRPALLLTIVLLFDFFIIFPHTQVLSSNFISYKKSEAKFNLAASEFGNSFGDWLLYLGGKKDDGTYFKVFLFNKKGKEEVLISAQKAQIINDSGILRLKLTDGEGYRYSKDKLAQIDFKTMMINDTMKTRLKTYKKPLEYWMSEHKRKKKERIFVTNFLLSVFPIISLFFVASMGIVHVRHQKSQVYLYLFLSIAIYYGLALGLVKALVFYTIPLVVLSVLLGTYFIYRKTIVNKF